MKDLRILYFILLGVIIFSWNPADAQENIAEQAYNIFQQNCFNCHGPSGSFRESLLIDHASSLIDSGIVIPGNPLASEFYKRLVEGTPEKPKMPWGLPPLSPQALATIEVWISQGAPEWQTQRDVTFITPAAMLTTIERHLSELPAFNRPFARYFTITHLYNAGDSQETLSAYKIALSKLINSLSWGYQVINPEPIDLAETIFYIDLRDYEWDRGDAWTQIENENVYPYKIEFDAETQAVLHRKLANLRQQMNCQVPYVYADWFIATASLPPLYHDILDLPTTDRALESQLGVDVARNLESAPGKRVWRAGFNDSGVSNNNRVVERHTSRHGAYWKSYDFAGNIGAQNVFTHPLSFSQDGGEMIFNLPNGLQAYMIVDELGNRIDVAPTDIVANPAASDPAVRNGLSCIGCHTEGMKAVEDEVRSDIQRARNPAYDKEQALRLYVEHAEMGGYVQEDIERYKVALEATGDTFGGLVEPVHRFHEVYQSPLKASHAAAAVGLQTDTFLSEIEKNWHLQNLGLTGLLSGGNVQRDTWTQQFQGIITALNTKYIPPIPPSAPTITGIVESDTQLTITYNAPINIGNGGPIQRYEYNLNNGIWLTLPNNRNIIGLTNGTTYDVRLRAVSGSGYGSPSAVENGTPRPTPTLDTEEDFRFTFPVPDANLRVAIAEALGKASGAEITEADMQRLRTFRADGRGIRDLTGLEYATNLERIELRRNAISDLTPLRGLIRLNNIKLRDNVISDVSPLANLLSVDWLGLEENVIRDLSPLKGLVKLEGIGISENLVTDVSSLASLTSLERIDAWDTPITDFSSLAQLPKLEWIEFGNDASVTTIPSLKGIKRLRRLELNNCSIKDLSPLKEFTQLEWLELVNNTISDISTLRSLKNLKTLNLDANVISDVSPLTELTGLEVLYLENNVISDVSPLAGLRNLERLDLRNNVIADFSPLDQLPFQTTIGTGGNPGPGLPSRKKITGPWLWMIVPTGDKGGAAAARSGMDFLSVASNGKVTELTVATNGATEGNPVGDKVWEVGELSAIGGDNLNDMANDTGLGFGNIDDHVAYGALTIESPKTQTVIMLVGSDDAVKVWLNGELVHNNPVDRGADDFQDRFSVTLKQGYNTLLVAVYERGGGWSGFFGFAPGTEYTVVPPGAVKLDEDTPIFPAWDVNKDGKTDIEDLKIVMSDLGKNPPVNPRSDANKDGLVDEQDAALIASHLGEKNDPAAPSTLSLPSGMRRETLQETLDLLHASDNGSLTFRRGIANLEELLALFLPQRTMLLANYPNPFNPETWIPYQLRKPADVRLTIYDAQGRIVRNLEVGHQPAGMYQSKGRAAYWDGRNSVGEPVASGVYFYTLSTGDFTATRKLLIRK